MFLNFSQDVSDGIHSCHFWRMWRKQACQRPRTACGNNTLHAILMPLFFQSVKCCETLAGAMQCQKVFNYTSLIALWCPVTFLIYAMIINASSSSLLYIRQQINCHITA